jgi:hypothetical protein
MTLLFWLLFFIVVIVPPLLFACLCTLPAIWLALGHSHMAIRMPLFLLSTLLLGLTLSIAETREVAVVALYVTGAALLVAGIASRGDAVPSAPAPSAWTPPGLHASRW